jgi:RimJ/RimL family protein N-acetyltransferase
MRFINSVIVEPKSGILMNKKTTLKEEKEWLRSRLTGTKSRRTVDLAVEYDGRIVGNCDVNRLPWKHAHRADMGVALAREIRGRGVGEALMTRTIELAVSRMRGLEMIGLSAIDYNRAALSLYLKLGFVEVGRVPMSFKEGEKYFDEVLMMLQLE